MGVKPDTLGKVLEGISKVYGPDTVHTADEKAPMERISTGAVELDWVTGGGIPIGRWSHFYGGFSSAKTMTCWNIIREAQKLGMDCAYYNLEKQYERDLLERRGIDTKKLLVVEGATIEGVGAKLESLMGAVHLHVLDSLAQGVSIEELRADIEDHHMGLQARTWAKVLRRANERFDDTENCVIMVNQVRDVFGRGGGESPPGGRLIDYISSLNLRFKRSSWLYRDGKGVLDPENKQGESMGGDKQPDGIEFLVRVDKSRVCQPLRAARLRLDFNTLEFDETWTLVKAATYLGVVDKTSPGRFVLPDGTKVHGNASLREAIDADVSLQQKIRDAIRAAA